MDRLIEQFPAEGVIASGTRNTAESQTQVYDSGVFVTYCDPVEKFRGYLAIDGFNHQIAAGGFRVQPGLKPEHIARLASVMTLKHRLAGNRVDGAKSGIDYDPGSPGKREAIKRFFHAVRPYIVSRYSLGPDLNTSLPEIDSIASELDIPSVKLAVAKAQGLSLDEFQQRYRVFQELVDGWSLASRRSGHGTAVSVLALLRNLGIAPGEATVAIQGFGGVGSACGYSLYRAGVRVVAVSDVAASLIAQQGGLDIPDLLRRRTSQTSVAQDPLPSNCVAGDRDQLFQIPCDVLVSASVENSFCEAEARTVNVRAVAEAANFSLSSEADSILAERGIHVLPDIVAGAGGVMSVGGLFSSVNVPTAADVLHYVGLKMNGLVDSIMASSLKTGRTLRDVATEFAQQIELSACPRPYGDE